MGGQRAILRDVAAELGLVSHLEDVEGDKYAAERIRSGDKYVVIDNMSEFINDIQVEINSIDEGEAKVLFRTFFDWERRIVHALALHMGCWPRAIPEGSQQASLSSALS